MGVVMPDAESYRVFWPLLRPLVAAFHRAHGRKVEQPRSEWPPPKRVDDFEGARVQHVLFEVRRNLSGYPLQPLMDGEDHQRMERTLRSVFGRMEGEYSGNYYPVQGALTAKVKRRLSLP